MISLIPPDRLDTVWHIIAPMLERALHYTGGRFRLVDVATDILNGQQTLWVAIEDNEIIGCATVSIVQYPGVKALCYEYLAGADVTRWLKDGHETISRYGKELGCTVLECQGRSGWKPFLEELGYRQFAVRYECNIED